MKKLISVILALMLIVSLTVSASATMLGAGAPQEKGSITISGVSTENEYSVYKMLTLESYDNNAGAYSYKLTDEKWAGFFATDAAKACITIDSSNYVTWTGSDTPAAVEAFSKAALAYAQANGIDPVGVVNDEVGGFVTSGEVTSAVFSDLELGYYLIDSTMGALCGLTTTVPDVTVSAKNSAPTIDKQVQEDSNGHWGASNTEGIGQLVEYRVTISVTGGAQNYALHDTMTEGLTFNPGSVSVHINGAETAVTAAGNYEVITSCTDGCTFEIDFTDAFCNGLKNGDEVVIYYDATLNENAIIEGAGDNNMAKLEFGENHYTTEDSVVTYTYGIEIVKTDESGTKLLDGAEFYIYDSLTGGNIIPVWKTTDAEGNVVYKVADKTKLPEDKPNGDIIDVENGRIKVVGFDNGTYYLQEETSPEGYNQLSSRQAFTVNNGNLYATFVDGIYAGGTGVQVKNKTGTILPSTGAMGTTMFLTFGSFVVLATGVLLITKKRMNMIEE